MIAFCDCMDVCYIIEVYYSFFQRIREGEAFFLQRSGKKNVTLVLFYGLLPACMINLFEMALPIDKNEPPGWYVCAVN